ncbi:MAG: right-handed parallel beta-helix repeat-containing protein [Candidatus Bipolaricaulota bacterium]|nr:right-handed parallel beta-helix repeat-containing protein [Candidatus Bipolaricaulota bacterium]
MVLRRGRAILVVVALSLGIAASCGARMLDVPGEYASIAAAVAVAVAGDEIVVAPGTYSENFVVATGITIRGGGPDRASTTIKSGDPEVSAVVVYLAAGEARLENLSFVTSGPGDGIEMSGSSEGTVRVVNCAFSVGPDSVGIAVENGTLVAESSLFRGSEGNVQVPVGTSGVAVGAGAAAKIRNCDFAYFADAIQTQGGRSLAVEACSVGYSVAGIAVRNQFSDSTTVQLAANQIYGCATGIILGGAVTMVMIQENTISDCSSGPFRVTAGSCVGGGEPFSGIIVGTANVVPQLDLLCPDEGSGFWPDGFFE